MSTCPLAVIGISAIFPGSLSATGFWRDIREGNDLIKDVPPTHWLIEDYYDSDPSAPDKTYGKRGAFLDTIDFDALGFGVPPSIMPATDTAQLLALIVAQRVLDDATQNQALKLDRERVSVILGVTSAQQLLASMVSRLQHPIWRKSLREMGLPESEVEEACKRIAAHYVPWQEATFPGLLGNVVAGRIANRLDLHGTNCVTDAACASTFSALSMAANELYLGDSDMVITGGVDTMNDIFMYMCFSKTPALSRSGDIRPFSDQSDGTILGEGLGMFALKRLEDAERDKDRIYAIINGIGSSSDGRSKSVYAPVSEGQARSLRRAYQRAGVKADTIELIEAHGTGTKAGDVAEFDGLKLVFNETGRQDRQWCALGSVKSQIGHTKAAAGAAGLFKAIMGVQHRVLPPTIKIDRPNPNMGVEQSPFYLNTQARPWVRGSDHPRRAGVSSFGFGGSNFHVSVEEYKGPNRADRFRSTPVELVLLSATSSDLLLKAINAQSSAPMPKGSLSAIARDSQKTFNASHEHRLAIVVKDEDALKASLTEAARRIPASPNGFQLPTGVFYGVGPVDGAVAFVFSGQGSQYTGMSDALAMEFDDASNVWDAAADLNFGGKKLHEVVFPRPVFSSADQDAQQTELTRTEWAQPAIGAVSLSMLSLLRKLGVKPSVVAGHSFGEITALHAAGVISEADTLRIARKRGEAMAEAAKTPGAMIAVSASIETCNQLLPELGGVVVANHNHPTQVVLSGALDAIKKAEEVLTQKRIASKRLPVATAFHSEVVSGAVDSLSVFLEGIEFHAPSLDVLADSTADVYPGDTAKIRAQLGQQLAKPVRFVEIIENMYARGVRTFIEVGPNAVLAGLVDKILGQRPHHAIELDRKGRNSVQSLWMAIGRLAASGHAMNLASLWEGFRVEDPRDLPKPKLAIALNGSNYEQAYPPKNGAAGLPKPNGPRATPEPQIIEKIVEIEVERIVEVPVAAASDALTSHQPYRTSVAVPQPTAMPTDDWLAAFELAQTQAAAAHIAFQESMAASHQAFLASVVASNEILGAFVGASTTRRESAVIEQPRITPAQLAPVVAPRALPTAPSKEQVKAAQPAPTPVAPPKAPAPKAPVAAPQASAPSIDLNALLLEVVSEKTGYPSDMLSSKMSLEADLGVDSIKRVEILSAMRDRAPNLPEVNASEMAALQTLGQIVDYMSAKGAAAPSTKTTSAAPAAPVSAPSAPSPSINLNALLLEVVAEKTGYPSDMLSPKMSLEADLGVDSIKRVEILSAMRDRAPGLPEVNASEMAALQTLGQIVDYMSAKLPAQPTSTAATPAPKAASAPKIDIDLNALLLEVVAEKTGYPSDMLTAKMSLEADLGVDSIKRVEILSAMRDRAPGLPEVNASEMAALQTLGQIVDYMSAKGAGAEAPAEKKNSTVTEATEERKTSSRFIVSAVPAPALGVGLRGLTVGEIQVTDDGRGVADALVNRLNAAGLHAKKVASVEGQPTGVIYLGALAALQDREAALALHREAFVAAKAHIKTSGVFVTVQATGGDFGLSGAGETAWAAGLPGLVKTAAKEWPEVGCKSIDIGEITDASRAAKQIAEELITGGPELEVGFLDGSRITLQATLQEVEGSNPTVTKESVIVASGGARGVTAEALLALAKKAGGSYVLLGRTPLVEEPASCAGLDTDAALKKALLLDARNKGEKPTPAEIGKQVSNILASREVKSTLSQMKKLGARARYVAADASDEASLKKALDEVRGEWGPITGIVHGAGVLADRSIADKTLEQFEFVFNTKINGLRSLLAATEKDPLNLIVLFSSVAARSGNRGQCDYAMANEVLNKVGASLARTRGIKVKSLGWGPWEGGMVTPELARHFASMGVPLISLAAGAKMFVDEVQGAAPHVELVLGGKPTLDASHKPTASLSIHVDRAGYPLIHDHRVNGAPVVPAMLAADWLIRAAKVCRPDLHFTALRELAVVRGIRLKSFDGAGDWFMAEARQLENGQGASIAVELKDADGVLRYQATAELREQPAKTTSEPAITSGLGAWGDKIIYDGVTLFHGPSLQVIREVEGISAEGLVASFSTNHSDAGLTPMLDGALQAALLWSEQVLQAATLPMKVGELKVFPQEAAVARVAVQREKSSADKATCTIRLLGAEGQVIALLRGVETIRRPDVSSAPNRTKESSDQKR